MLAYTTVSKTTVVVGIGRLRVNANGLIVVLEGTLEMTKLQMGRPPAYIGAHILRVEANRLIELGDGLFIAALTC